MFHYLDEALKNLFDSAPPDGADDLFVNADISFETPGKGFIPKQGDVAINLFLYEVKENRGRKKGTRYFIVNERGKATCVPLFRS